MVVGVVPAVEAGVDEVVRDSTGIPRPARRASFYPIFCFHTSPSPFIHSDSQKKVHQGWGGDEATTELKAEEGAVADAAADSGAAADWGADAAAPADWSAPADGDAAVPAAEGDAKPEGRRREREPEEEDNTLTLDQYLAQQKEKDTVVPKLQATRQANEGQDDFFKDAVAINKNEEEEAYFAGKVCSILSIAPHPILILPLDQVCSQDQGQEGGEGLPRDRRSLRTSQHWPRPWWSWRRPWCSPWW